MQCNWSTGVRLFTVIIALLGLPVLGLSKADAADPPTVQITFPERWEYYSGISRAEVTVGQSADRVVCQLYYYYVGNYDYQYWNWVTGEWQDGSGDGTMTEAVFDAATGSWKHSGPFPDTWEPSTDGHQRTYALYARAYYVGSIVGTNVNYFHIDKEPPTIDLTLGEPLHPANNEMVLAAEVSVSDNVDPAPGVVINVASSDVVKGGKDKARKNKRDWQIVQEGDVWQIWLRAKKTGRRTTRVYTIDVLALDAAGNAATESATVTVVP